MVVTVMTELISRYDARMCTLTDNGLVFTTRLALSTMVQPEAKATSIMRPLVRRFVSLPDPGF